MEIKKGGVVYFLDRGAYNVNNPEELAVKMDIIEKDGKLYAHAKQGYFTLQFEVEGKKVEELTEREYPSLFATREAALAQYNKENNNDVNNIMEMTKEEMLKQFFQAWDNQGTAVGDMKRRQAMKDKIKKEFSVEV